MQQPSVKKIITNRQLNFTLSPVDTHNHKEMPYALNNYEIDGTWNHHQSIILDVIVDWVFNSIYAKRGKLPQSWRSKKTVEVIDRFSNGRIKPETIDQLSYSPLEAYIKNCGYDLVGKMKEVYDNLKNQKVEYTKEHSFEDYMNYQLDNNREYQGFKEQQHKLLQDFHTDYKATLKIPDLFENYSILSRYKYNWVKHLKRIADTRFKMTYKVKFMSESPEYNDEGKLVSRGNLIDLYYRMPDLQHIVLAKVEGDQLNLNFNTPLGKLVLHNTLIMDTDWMPVEAANLSKNAYFLFKRFVLNKRYGKYKAESIPLKFDEMRSYLDLRWSNDRGVHAAFASAFDDMIDKGLLEGYTVRGKPVARRVYTLKFPHREKKKVRKDGDAKLLKLADYKA
jgi:hypothetical protein